MVKQSPLVDLRGETRRDGGDGEVMYGWREFSPCNKVLGFWSSGTRALGLATAGQSLKKDGPFFARKKLGIARSEHFLGEPK